MRSGIVPAAKHEEKTIREHQRYLLLNMRHEQTYILYQHVHVDVSVLYVSINALSLTDVEWQ